jgi:hypothetical protein
VTSAEILYGNFFGIFVAYRHAPEKILLAEASPCKPWTDEIWLQDVLLSFELIEKPCECYHVIALPINITFILGGIPLFLRCVGIDWKFPRIAKPFLVGRD